ncbi:DMT family transporter [Klebsiella pneumoniae]|nr:DMT family transporter [Klebsiella pneumoniae]
MPYLLLTLAALFWGGNYVVGHVLVQGVDPILMTEARWALTALLSWACSPTANRRQSPPAAQTRQRWWCSPSVARPLPLTLYIGLQTTSALNAAIHVRHASMVLLINRLLFRDPVSGRNWLGVAFSTLGVMILLFQETYRTPPAA